MKGVTDMADINSDSKPSLQAQRQDPEGNEVDFEPEVLPGQNSNHDTNTNQPTPLMPEHSLSETDTPPPHPIPNIVLFGASGCGKSSIINMLAGTELAKTVSNRAVSLFQNEKYQVEIDGQWYNIHDTTGLSDGHDQSSLSQEAINQLKKLIHDLNDGVNLLLFCLRAPRITDGAAKNYAMFYRELCSSRVPIAIIITGLENEDNMEDWWVANEHTFTSYKMRFVGHACITATRGKKTGDGYKNQKEYDESRNRTESLIKKHAYRPGEEVEVSKGILEEISARLKGLILDFFQRANADTSSGDQQLDTRPEQNYSTSGGSLVEEREAISQRGAVYGFFAELFSCI
ncbi:hypothetical protein VKT23_011656 [Stygiomarasmius scandens]|uniref:G domain-containing protein n=1 Tax=Marasmiellus scandens TaxID=2682957 RepID=A0ABR1JB27_9AGAR